MKAMSRILFAALFAAGLAPGVPAVADELDLAVAAAPDESRVRNRADRLDLDTTVVTGNRELPKVMYIVPWKKAGLGTLPGQPFNTLLDEVLDPLDRDEFRREVRYFEAVSAPRTDGPERP
ncbi:MAG TPA: hypothetical protein VLT59_00875 [Steroidobacteraceae bacterium]|nr:hypothetical protein [Steroidobacteraceae bacterium]